MQNQFFRIVTLLGAVGLAACAEEPKTPDLTALYDNAATIETQARRPVISIPGTLGSRLIDEETGIAIWGGDDGLGADPNDPTNARLIALPFVKNNESFRSLKDTVKPRGVVRVARASILGTILEVDVYAGVISTLIAGGFDFRQTREESCMGTEAFRTMRTYLKFARLQCTANKLIL